VNGDGLVSGGGSVPGRGAADANGNGNGTAAGNGHPARLNPDAPVAIDVQRVGVQYSLRFTKKTTLHRTFVNLFSGRRPDEFWALRDVSFQLRQGESLAVIGPNGAGKSTLLQVLAGIILPSAGSVDVRGRISSLLTLGVGFDQELTGVENIRLAGAFLGVPGREMERRTPEIIEFADLGPFIDAPIKTYSAGMRARLGFSIATSVDPDILLLDEVLGTGDAVFRAKSKVRVQKLIRQARGVVLVTHDMSWVTDFCNRAILLEKGHIVLEGEPEEVVALHQEHSERARAEREEKIAKAMSDAGSGPPPPDAATAKQLR
jgi:ABC-type polysaccharide/polyol phosphate transport system ATPase subunit